LAQICDAPETRVKKSGGRIGNLTARRKSKTKSKLASGPPLGATAGSSSSAIYETIVVVECGYKLGFSL
jgi:hypothetical protein